MSAEKPLPPYSDWTKPYWEAANNHKFTLQYCENCEKYIFYPRICCPYCFSEVKWAESSGRGHVYSFTVVYNNAPSAFSDDIPFVVALVRLEEGVQMLTNIVECPPESVYINMPVEVTFKRMSREIALPVFKPTETAGCGE